MKLFLHNFIADLRGPDFLILYGTFFLVVWLVRVIGIGTARLVTPSPRVPKDMDPYKFAYLRGGVNELVGAIQFSLYQRGYIEKGHDCLICAPGHPDVRHLRDVERKVFEAFQSGNFRASSAAELVEGYGKRYEIELQDQGLMVAPGSPDVRRLFHGGGFILFAGLGVYKLTVAFMKGYTNVTLLIFGLLFGSVIFAANWPREKITLKGEKYLSELRKALDEYRIQLSQRSTTMNPEEKATAEPKTTLIMAVFGAGALLGTAYADLFASAAPALASSGSTSFFSGFSSCSSCSSFSSSCSSCSSCGGGCGGCGGCGG